MRRVFRAGVIWKGLWPLSLSIFLAATAAMAFTINQDGKDLVQQASQAYAGDMRNRPTVTQPGVRDYVQEIARRLVPREKIRPPA